MTADPDEPDAALLDQPTREALGGAEHLGGLGDGQQPVGPGVLAGFWSCRPPGCRKLGRCLAAGSGSGQGECGVPALPVGDDVQQPLGGGHVVGVAGGDGFPGVAGRVGRGESRGFPGAIGGGRRGGRRGSCRTTCGRPGRGARRSRGARGGALCLGSARGAGPAGGSWAGRRSAASSRTSASTARSAAPRPAVPRAPAGRGSALGGSRRRAWSGTW